MHRDFLRAKARNRRVVQRKHKRETWVSRPKVVPPSFSDFRLPSPASNQLIIVKHLNSPAVQSRLSPTRLAGNSRSVLLEYERVSMYIDAIAPSNPTDSPCLQNNHVLNSRTPPAHAVAAAAATGLCSPKLCRLSQHESPEGNCRRYSSDEDRRAIGTTPATLKTSGELQACTTLLSTSTLKPVLTHGQTVLAAAMPQLVPFYFVNEVVATFTVLPILIYVFSKYLLPQKVRLMAARLFISKL